MGPTTAGNGGDLVLVTGITGFIAGHVAVELLRAGYRVRGTVRTLEKAGEVRRAVEGAGVSAAGLSFAEADLGGDAGWIDAAQGCRFVQHVASPFPMSLPRERMALVPAAVGGTRRVLSAASRAGVERVIVTSSVAAVQYGHEGRVPGPFTEADVSDVDAAGITPYAISKTLAERAAWEEARERGLSLVSINPGVVFGPLLGPRLGTSATMIAMMMRGRLRLVPDVAFAVVDVRDVAAAHVAALGPPEAVGRRFVLAGGTRSMREIGGILAASHPAYAGRMPRGTIPDGLVRVLARVYPPVRQILPELGTRKSFDCRPAEDILGLRLRSPEEAVIALADGLVAQRQV